tara:strand:+ start:659 stop:1006 length:348 start_codon:yes stop_codon:yes gene_type:complete
MHIEPVLVYYIDCPVNTPVYDRDNRLIGYTDGYRARPTATTNGSICLSSKPIKKCSECRDDDAEYNFPDSSSEYCYSCSREGMVNRKDFNWIRGEGVYVVGMGIKLSNRYDVLTD